MELRFPEMQVRRRLKNIKAFIIDQERGVRSFLAINGRTKRENIAVSPFRLDFVAKKTINILELFEN